MEKRTVSRNDVAKLAGTAPSTVSNVINNTKYVSDEVREKVISAIKQLNYEPNLLARSLKTKRTKQIVVLVNDLYNLYYADICAGVIEYAEKNKYVVLICITCEKKKNYYTEFYSRQIDGIINFSSHFCDEDTYEKLKNNGIAMLNCRCFDTENSVGINYIHAMESFVNAISEKGRKTVAIISDSSRTSLFNDTRYIGLKYNLEKKGLSIDDNLIIDDEVASGELELQHGYKSMEKLLKINKNIDAVFCFNDMIAFGACEYLDSINKKIFEDISICGCDDIFFSNFMSVKISTMSFDKKEFGRKCMKNILLQLQKGNYKDNSEIVYASFINRKSV